jgi:hypothetical protein
LHDIPEVTYLVAVDDTCTYKKYSIFPKLWNGAVTGETLRFHYDDALVPQLRHQFWWLNDWWWWLIDLLRLIFQPLQLQLARNVFQMISKVVNVMRPLWRGNILTCEMITRQFTVGFNFNEIFKWFMIFTKWNVISIHSSV